MNRVLILTSIVAALVLSAGCATKEFVRNRVDPLDVQVREVDERTAKNLDRIDGLEKQVDKDVSRLDERTLSAQTRADEAMDQAKNAQKTADGADDLAGEAHEMADRGLEGLDGLGRTLDAMQDYRLARDEAVYFAFNSAELNDESQQVLGQVKQAIGTAKSYAVAVRGFTDSTGAADYNVALSKRRAEAVVRSLATKHGVPLYRIHLLGLGSETPAADNKTRAGRKQNRRVEVKVFLAASESPEVVSRLNE